MAGGGGLESRVRELEKQLGWALARIAKLEAENAEFKQRLEKLEQLLTDKRAGGVK